jgi:hypothetical protein
MNKNISTLVVLLFFMISVQAQTKISLQGGFGYFLSNSENSSKIMGDKEYRSNIPLGFSFQTNKLFGQKVSFEYSYNKIMKKDVLTFIRTAPDNPTPIGHSGIDATLVNHNFDLNYIGNIYPLLTYGIGPSFVITNRIIESGSFSPPDGFWAYYYDKLASSGLGANVFIDLQIPFSEEQNYFYFTSKLKVRYTYSIWFDEGIRKLDDYYQEFVTTNLTVGIGYSF